MGAELRRRSLKPVYRALPLFLALALCALSGQARGQTDPRRVQRAAFPKGLKGSRNGTVATSGKNVALLFLGDGWEPCASFVLKDLIMGLDKTRVYTVQPLPKRIAPKGNYLGNGKFACFPTVSRWWDMVRDYQSRRGAKVTDEINYFGSYYRSAKQANKFNFISEVIDDVATEMVNTVPQKLFKTINADPATKANTIIVTLLGSGVPLGLLSSSELAAKCAIGFYQNPDFPEFYGSVLAFGPQFSNFSSTCNPFPKYSSDLKQANGCPQADYLSTHILARLADLMTNPSQFKYEVQGDGYILDQPQSEDNIPAYTCTLALDDAGQYSGTGKSCSAGQVCDLRFMSKYSITGDLGSSSFNSDAPSSSPEALALGQAVLFERLTLANTIGAGYFHFLQPYRNFTTGSCYFPKEVDVTNYRECFWYSSSYGV